MCGKVTSWSEMAVTIESYDCSIVNMDKEDFRDVHGNLIWQDFTESISDTISIYACR